MTDEQIAEIALSHGLNDYINEADAIAFARALLSASIADTAGAKPVAQWQTKLREPILPECDTWINVSEEGARKAIEKWSHVYEVRALVLAAPPAPSSDTAGAKACVAQEKCSWPACRRECVIDSRGQVKPDAAPPAPSVADAAGASEALPENIDWTRVMALAEKHGDGWSDEKGWSFRCDDDLFNFAGELAKESGND
ncbi:hypothetical protein [Caballeronia sp. AZ7_KS35]|uniref:hypothetical protein n=1 Tax=Caballeronia sp. AZ7_KS35 TaxID=2921762 RepID=UPI0020288BB9|nr:hypothetical protein [Caballeronia sp. AZ7_KS35]